MMYKNKRFIKKIAEEKIAFHSKQAKLTYEEKFKIILELQKIDMEFLKSSKVRRKDEKFRMLWKVKDL